MRRQNASLQQTDKQAASHNGEWKPEGELTPDCTDEVRRHEWHSHSDDGCPRPAPGRTEPLPRHASLRIPDARPHADPDYELRLPLPHADQVPGDRREDDEDEPEQPAGKGATNPPCEKLPICLTMFRAHSFRFQKLLAA
jgi:hypothetical protein